MPNEPTYPLKPAGRYFQAGKDLLLWKETASLHHQISRQEITALPEFDCSSIDMAYEAC